MRAEIESAESDEDHDHHWTYCPDSCLLDQYDPEGSEERWQKEEARFERMENPSSGADYLARGISYGHRGNYDRALEDLHEAVRQDPSCAEAYYWRGLTYAFKQEYALAIQDFDRAAELRPDDARTYMISPSSWYQTMRPRTTSGDRPTFPWAGSTWRPGTWGGPSN